jgi:hypothetical protein
MAKRVDPLKAKEAKQKKIAAIGGVLLLALVAVQGPKTLKMLQGPQPVTSAASTAPTTTTAAPTPAQAPTDEAPAAGTADLAAVADSDAAPVVEPGQLATFERFASKDPFVQQGGPPKMTPRVSNPNVGTGSSASGGAPAPGAQPDEEAGGEEAGGGSTGGFTTGEPAPSGPDEPAVAEATTIAVNGVAEDVAVEGAFPKDEPTFVLVEVAEDGKSVQIGIAGGEYAGGGETMTLGLGKKLTLQNTADGSRYELELRSVAGFPLPKQQG